MKSQVKKANEKNFSELIKLSIPADQQQQIKGGSIIIEDLVEV